MTTDRDIAAAATETFEEYTVPFKTLLANKWGIAVDAGFQAIPNVLIRAQKQLGLDSVDVVILLNLNLHWWEKEALPFPAPSLIANRMGVSRRTVERRIVRLQKGGWLKRLPATGEGARPRVRKYDLSGMVQKLQDAAIVGLSRRAYRAADRQSGSPNATPPGAKRGRPLLFGNG